MEENDKLSLHTRWIEYYRNRPVTEGDLIDGLLPWELYERLVQRR